MAAPRQLLTKIVPEHWDSQDPSPGSGYNRVRYLQNVNDLVNRPVANRANISTNATAIACNGNVQSSGIGTALLQPLRYSEFTVKARVTFNINSAGPAFIYVYRTLVGIPANGAAPDVTDVIVGGDAFMGGPTSAAVNQSGAFSYIDTGLDSTKRYQYYLAVKGPNTNTLNLINNSQLFVMERS